MTVMSPTAATEYAKTVAALYKLGTRQQHVLEAMLQRGRWPVALPESGSGSWYASTSWSACAKVMAALERKGVLETTGEIHTSMGHEDVPVYVIAEVVAANAPNVVRGQQDTEDTDPLVAPAEQPGTVETPTVEGLLRDFRAVHAESSELYRRASARSKDAEAISAELQRLGTTGQASRRISGDTATVIADALTYAATHYAYALGAMYVDVTANMDALNRGRLRQVSSNGTELLVRFGAMADLLDIARKVLTPGEISDILTLAAVSADRVANVGDHIVSVWDGRNTEATH